MELEIQKVYGGGYYENDGLVAGNQGFSDWELAKGAINSSILKQYKFKDALIRHTATVDFAKRHTDSIADLKFRADF